MNRVLRTRELVDMILFTLPPSDLGNTICVNYLFFHASMPFLWKTVRLKDALDVLGTTKMGGPGSCRCYGILEPPTYQTWRRFFEYSSRVRVLIGFGRDAFALQDAVRFLRVSTRNLPLGTTDYLFPGCHSLEWHGTNDPRTADIDPLISPNLEKILLEGWDLHDINSEWFSHLSRTLTTRVSRLKVFHLDTVQDIEPDERMTNLTPFLNIVSTFAQSLTSLDFPAVLVTDETVEKLSQTTGLSQLHIHRRNAFSFDIAIDKRSITRQNDVAKEFLLLEDIALGPLVSPVIAFNMFSRSSFSSLRKLNWIMPWSLPDHIILDLLAMIGSKCPELQSLTLVGEIPVETSPIIPWTSFYPILQCSKLISLKLRYCKVNMTYDNYSQLVRSRQGSVAWRVLQVLTAVPFHFANVLGLFARYSPGIQALSLNVSVNGEDVTNPFDFTHPFQTPMHSLPRIPNFSLFLKTRFSPPERDNQQILTLLPFLTVIDFSFSDLSMSLPYTTQIAALLLALSEKPMYVTGSCIDFLNQIYAHTLDYHMDLEKTTREPMSTEVEEYIDYCRDWFARPTDFGPEESHFHFDSFKDIIL